MSATATMSATQPARSWRVRRPYPPLLLDPSLPAAPSSEGLSPQQTPGDAPVPQSQPASASQGDGGSQDTVNPTGGAAADEATGGADDQVTGDRAATVVGGNGGDGELQWESVERFRASLLLALELLRPLDLIPLQMMQAPPPPTLGLVPIPAPAVGTSRKRRAPSRPAQQKESGPPKAIVADADELPLWMERWNRESTRSQEKRLRTAPQDADAAAAALSQDAHGINQLVRAIVDRRRPVPPTLFGLQRLVTEGHVVELDAAIASEYRGVTTTKVKARVVYQAWVTVPGSMGVVLSSKTGKVVHQIYVAASTNAEAAARARDSLIVKMLLCGLRWRGNGGYNRALPELNFPIEDYLEDMRRPRVAAMADWREYKRYLLQEVGTNRHREYVEDFHGVFWNMRREVFQASVWDSAAREYVHSMKRVVQRRKVEGAENSKVVVQGFKTPEEAAVAYDKLVIRMGAWREASLNYSVLQYVKELVASPVVQAYIASQLGEPVPEEAATPSLASSPEEGATPSLASSPEEGATPSLASSPEEAATPSLASSPGEPVPEEEATHSLAISLA